MRSDELDKIFKRFANIVSDIFGLDYVSLVTTVAHNSVGIVARAIAREELQQLDTVAIVRFFDRIAADAEISRVVGLLDVGSPGPVQQLVAKFYDEDADDEVRLFIGQLIAKVALAHHFLQQTTLGIEGDSTAFELRSTGNPSTRYVADALIAIDTLYGICLDLLDSAERESLVLDSIESGSNIRFSLRGLPEAIERAAKFVMQVWDRIKFSDHAQIKADNAAIFDTLELVEAIEEKREKGAIDGETAKRLRTVATNAALKLIESRTLPCAVPEKISVSTNEVLEQFATKRLPPPPKTEQDDGNTKKASKPTRRRTKSKKSSK